MSSTSSLLMTICAAALCGSVNAGSEPYSENRPHPFRREPAHSEEGSSDPWMPLREPKGTGQPHCEPWVRGPYESIQVNADRDECNIVGDAANEPSIAVDPTDPSRIVIGWRQFDTIESNFRQAGWGYSHDGGHTWTFPGVLEPGVFRSDPVLDADADGNIYFYSIRCTTLGCGDLFKSTDSGVSWEAPVFTLGGDKPWMTIDRTDGIGRGHIYALESSFNLFLRSTDGGASFELPTQVGWMWGTMSVGPSGALYALGVGGHFTRSVDAQDPEAVPTFDLALRIELCTESKSTSGHSADKATEVGLDPNPAGLLGQPWIATDHSNGPTRGNVYVLERWPCWGDDQLMFARSVDGGLTWSEPVRINDDPLDSGAWQWFGTMSVAPNGRVDVVWNDTRNSGVVNLSELFYSYSTDAGMTWSENVPISPMFDSHIGWPNQWKLGDYYDMVSDDLGVNVAYAATFNGEQDIYFLRIGPYDCNNNRIPDGDDLAKGTSEDCNANEIPDECERDCNESGVPDDCDIVAGTSSDDDMSGVPDECENLVLFVDADADGANDGSGWEDAFRDLQSALVAASDPRLGVNEVWVAAGTYKPDRGTERRRSTFRLPGGVGIYGGFAGGEAELGQRDPELNPTILSGDSRSNDGLSEFSDSDSDCCQRRDTPGCDDAACEQRVCAARPSCCIDRWDAFCEAVAWRECCELCTETPTACDNAYHVVTSGARGRTTSLDGFTITGGRADGSCSGYDDTSCAGAGILSYGDALRLNDCTLTKNEAHMGAGLFIRTGSPILTNCRFEQNTVVGPGSWWIRGGGVYNDRGSPALVNCVFRDNLATLTGMGGGMYTYGGNPALTKCIFRDNLADYGEGGAIYADESKLTAAACTFIGNRAAGSTGGAVEHYRGTVRVESSWFEDNYGEYGGAISGLGVLTVDDSYFVGNVAGSHSGGAISGGTGTVTNCTFLGNRARSGGAISEYEGTLANCLLAGNSAFRGGAVEASAALLLYNCTFANNPAVDFGGGVLNRYDTVLQAVNCVFWGNSDMSGVTESAQIHRYQDASSPIVNYSCLQGLTGLLGGVGNNAADPAFTDPLGLDGIAGTLDDDLRLVPGSPVINVGDPAFDPTMIDTDLDDQPRLQGCRVDMGAYESSEVQQDGDFDGDHDIDLRDVASAQICFGEPGSMPEWSKPCLCVFDLDSSSVVDLEDHAAFRLLLEGP